MQRINTTNKAADLFGAGKHGFRDGNLGSGIAATEFQAVWCNGVQEEVLNVVEAAGLVPSAGAFNQLLQALRTTALTGYRGGRAEGTAQSGGMGANATRTNTLTFIPPCSGRVLAIAAINPLQQQNVSVGHGIVINGTSHGGDSSTLSIVNVATSAATVGVACTITQTTVTEAVAPAYGFTSQLSYIFLPGQ